MEDDNQHNTSAAANDTGAAAETHESADALRQVKLDKLAALQAAGKDHFAQVRYDRTHMAADILARFEELEGQEVVLAGRLMSKRDMGKAGFGDLSDESGRIQLYFKTDLIGAEAFALFSQLDLGDILGAKGIVFKTRTGQISVQLSEFTLLSKILASLPEKFHGLTDIEQRYRQRYVDLIMNREVLERFQKRSLMLREIRNFLDARGFLEVETPMLHAIAGGATAEPFVTHWNVLKADYYLRIAIELHLKRLIVGGMEKVYEIGRVFRNEGVSTRHNPEFSMLELYWAYVDYNDILELTEALIVSLADKVFKTRSVQFGEYSLDLTPPFRRMTFDAAMREYAGVGLDGLRTLEDVKREAARLNLPLPKDGGYEKSLDELWKLRVEPHLVQPTFITDFPLWISPLAKRIPPDELVRRGYPADLELCYRFELFIATLEIAPSFSELNDPLDQRDRFTEQIRDFAGEQSGKLAGLLAMLARSGSEDVTASAEFQRHSQAIDTVAQLIDAYIYGRAVSPEGLDKLDLSGLPEVVRMAALTRAVGSSTHTFSVVNSLRPTLEAVCEHYEGYKPLDPLRAALEETRRDMRLDEDFLTALDFAMPPTGGLGIGMDRLMMVLSGTDSIREVLLFPQLRGR